MNAQEADALVASVQKLTATVNERLAGFETRLKPMEKFLDNPIPARSRSARVGEYSALPTPEQQQVVSATAERKAFGDFLKGDDDALSGFGGASDLAAAGFGYSSDSESAGGYTVVPQMSQTIAQKRWDLSPIGRLARRETITSGDSFDEPVDAADIDAAWVGEQDDRPELDPGSLRMLHVPLNEIYTNQPVTQKLLDLSSYDLGAWLENKISDKFARTEGNGFILGDGVGKPLGLLKSPLATTADGVRDYFTIQYLETAGAAVIDPEELISLVYMLRAPYRANARWMMNTKTAGVLRKIKDDNGNFIWANSLADGQPDRLLGYPVEFDEEMPDVGATTIPIAFGDFRQAYIIVDRPGVKVLLDPYTKKPWVLFYAYRRVGGQLQNGEAVKLLKMHA